ncbi:MAG: tubulin-like doman-containing protein [Gordonia sp. (in: high G+C Gram-positive bacteria)]
MKRLLIVGCGGSGGAALAYMMDQLRSDLAGHGIGAIPAGWQFVHLDVPTSPSSVEGVGTVEDLHGEYVGTGPESDSYQVLDNAMTQRLAGNQAIDAIATWAPREPETVYTPLSTGAGQYRALGRMITLSRVGLVRDRLQAAWDRLYLTSTISEMQSLSIPGAGSFSADDQPLILVVSSMAGGAGASMALDVCRILTLVKGVDPRLMAVFMVTPDIFETLPPSAVTGTRANALAMLGEIVAAQVGAARPADVALLRALGYERGEGERIPFARVFPVGRYVGAQRTVFGDGTPTAVYRGLGRGLAGLALSGPAMQQFVEWDLTNGVGDQGSLEFLGWGNRQWNNIPWGTFGYASLSMGRDRYAEYAAQRLARASADKLLHGHRQAGNDASDEEQVNGALDNQWDNICRRLGLPVSSDPTQAQVGQWLGMIVLPPQQVGQYATGIINATVRPRIDQQPGVNGEQWTTTVYRVLAEQRETIKNEAANTAYAVAYNWHQYFANALQHATTEALATLGLPYATGLVKRVARLMSDVVLPECQQLSGYAPADVVEPRPEVARTLASLKGTLANTAAVSERVLGGLREPVERQIYASLAYQIANAAGAVIGEIFDPLITALNESQTLLRQAAAAPRRETGLAHLQTIEYAAWPADSDERVAARFSEADNEVMLTRSGEFKQRYEIDLPGAVGANSADPQAFRYAVSRAAGHVITGLWTTVAGTRPPGDHRPTVERTAAWVSRAFPRHPESGETLIASPAAFDVHTRPDELLSRAREFVARPGEAFDRFCSVSLREYVTGRTSSGLIVAESELAGRRRDLLLRFGEAVSLARPLASVNENAMQAIHGVSEMVYRYKFSAVPFHALAVADDLAGSLGQQSRVDTNSVGAFTNALTDEANIKRIDIFGSYPNYSPLAYDSVIEPANRQWLESSTAERAAFWTHRRARPLPASLPMTPEERRTMVGGWLLGRTIGMISIPEAPYTQAARVWDGAARRWLPFPTPLLTPPADFLAEYDWLPAILESVLLAIAASHQPPAMSSMHPYRALRRIYDAAEQNTSSGLDAEQQAARTNMTQWLRTGNTGTGVASIIADTGEDVDVDTRADRLAAYFTQYRAFVGQHFIRPGDGDPPAPGGGVFSTITVRKQATKTPFFRDLAPDVYWAASRLLDMIPAATAAAKHRPAAPRPLPESHVPTDDDFAPPTFDGKFL